MAFGPSRHSSLERGETNDRLVQGIKSNMADPRGLTPQPPTHPQENQHGGLLI